MGVEVQDVELEPHGLQVFVNAPTWTLPQTVQATLPTMLRATCSLRFSLCQVTDFHLGVGFFFFVECAFGWIQTTLNMRGDMEGGRTEQRMVYLAR